MNTGKCPGCGKPVQKARVEIVRPDMDQTKLYGGAPSAYAFVCTSPGCNTILPLSVMPEPPAKGR